MPQANDSANPKERVSFGSGRSSALCFRLCKAKEGSDRKTLSASVEQKAREDGDRKSTLRFRLALTDTRAATERI